MSLTTRLSAFALAGLALMLAGFSAALYGTAAVYLGRQIEARTDAALHALYAAVEVHPADVQWEPLERKISLGGTEELEQVRWTLQDEIGQFIDRSANLDGGSVAATDGPWTFAAWVARAGRFEPEVVPVVGFDAGVGLTLPADRTKKSTVFKITVAVSHAPAAALLRQVAAILAGVSLATWLVAALTMRAVCRRALRPIAAMATSARMLGDDPARRLDMRPTGDELEDLGAAFNGLLSRLHVAYDRQRRFTGDAAHQLRTPLAAMLGQLEVALRSDRPADEYRRVLGVVRRRADGLRQVVESLLFLARAGVTDRLDLMPLDLAEWLAGRRDDWAGRDIVWDIPGRPLVACVHAGLLGQALDNLIDNALKYGDDRPVRVVLGSESGRVLLAVADDGCGIDAADRPHLGEPFFRAASARQRGVPGVGLGLSVVRRVAELFGGELLVESQPGVGSRFSIALPAVVPQSPVPGVEPCLSESEAAALR